MPLETGPPTATRTYPAYIMTVHDVITVRRSQPFLRSDREPEWAIKAIRVRFSRFGAFHSHSCLLYLHPAAVEWTSAVYIPFPNVPGNDETTTRVSAFYGPE